MLYNQNNMDNQLSLMKSISKKQVPIISTLPQNLKANKYILWQGDTEKFIDKLPSINKFDLVVTSPPYNLGKEYETKKDLKYYLDWQERIIKKIVPKVKDTGSICWQVGNYIDNGSVWPLDIELAPIFRSLGLQLRNRIIWRFGHGLHAQKRFSGRYEVILWFTKTDDYVFNLDPVRVPSKYPGKKHYKGPKAGEYSGNPKGKNPEDIWEIPNVNSNHIEKTIHPCQFPVGLIERLILSLTNEKDLIFDPFAGVASTGVAAAIHGRRFWGTDISKDYLKIGQQRIIDALNGMAKYRSYKKPIYDHTKSKLSQRPTAFTSTQEDNDL
jgi:adenine-specific DNA-methyltransferase